MVWIPGGTFRMGSDGHYPEEAPVHFVHVDGFWMDRTPVTNGQFRRFVEASGHVTFAEKAPDAKDIRGRCRTCSRPDRWSLRRPGIPWT
jgi:formylglycine-generating enzyme